MKPVRWSNLKYMAQSPLHYRYYLDNPIKTTPAMGIGTAVHAMLLDGKHGFTVWPEARRGKAWAEFAEANAGKTILTQSEYETASAITASVLEDRFAAHLLQSGHREARLEWLYADRACAGTPDVVDPETSTLVDLKISHTADPSRFGWHALNMGWVGQLAWYKFAVESTFRFDPENVFIVAVENKPPYCTQIYRITGSALDMGKRLWTSYMERLRVCEASDNWPGYSQAELPLDAPGNDPVSLSLDGEEFVL